MTTTKTVVRRSDRGRRLRQYAHFIALLSVCPGIGHRAPKHRGTASPDGDPRLFVRVGLWRARPTGVFPDRHYLVRVADCRRSAGSAHRLGGGSQPRGPQCASSPTDRRSVRSDLRATGPELASATQTTYWREDEKHTDETCPCGDGVQRPRGHGNWRVGPKAG